MMGGKSEQERGGRRGWEQEARLMGKACQTVRPDGRKQAREELQGTAVPTTHRAGQ